MLKNYQIVFTLFYFLQLGTLKGGWILINISKNLQITKACRIVYKQLLWGIWSIKVDGIKYITEGRTILLRFDKTQDPIYSKTR